MSIFLQLSDELGSKEDAVIAIDMLYDMMTHAKDMELSIAEHQEVWQMHARLCIDDEYIQYVKQSTKS